MNNFKMRKLITCVGILSCFSISPVIAGDDLMDRLILNGSDSSERNSGLVVRDYDQTVSGRTGEVDTSNPYVGKLHRVFDCGYNPSNDHKMFTERVAEGVQLYKSQGVTQFSNQYSMFKSITDYLPGGAMGYDGGKPVIAMFTGSKQVFLIYRVYESKDGRSKLLCYYNSQGKIGHGGRGFEEAKFILHGFKRRNGFLFVSGSSKKAVKFGLIDPANDYTGASDINSGMSDYKDNVSKVDSIMGSADSDWEKNPPHPDNIGYGENQVEGKVKSTSDMFSSIMEPVMFGAKIGMGAYMLKQVFKKDKDKDDDDQWDNGYGGGYGNGMGYGGGMDYGNGSIMGGGQMGYPGQMPGMYPGAYPQPGGYPGAYPGMTPPYQQGGYPGAYPGQMPPNNSTYPGAYPSNGGYPNMQMPPQNYPGSNPSTGYNGGGGQYPPQTYPGTNPSNGYNGSPGGYNGSGVNPGGMYDQPMNGLPAYTPGGGSSYPLPGNNAPMAPLSPSSSNTGSTNSYGLDQTITQNNNSFLGTIQ